MPLIFDVVNEDPAANMRHDGTWIAAGFQNVSIAAFPVQQCGFAARRLSCQQTVAVVVSNRQQNAPATVRAARARDSKEASP